MTGNDSIRILVVDDDESGRYLKTHVLRRNGYSVAEAGLGREALRLVEAEPPDLVLLDVKLPDMSGLDVCRQIKAMPTSVVVLQTSAAFVTTRDRAVALEGGADSYLIEPMEPEELISAVSTLLRMRHAERALRALNETLEQKVAQRTQELAETNRRLAIEIEERGKAEEALHHAQKLDALGRLTGGVAHDFNNLLTVVLGNLDMIEQGLAQSPPISSEHALRLIASGRRAAQGCEYLTRQMLAFARRDPLRITVLSVNEAVTGFEDFLRRALGEAITLEISLAPSLWRCRLDPGQLEAAILNLTVNARDAMQPGGTLRISTSNVAIDATRGTAPPGTYFPGAISPGNYVAISVADCGAGMSEETLHRAFEPFFTTKDIGRGSGLGLSQVYGFVKHSDGFISVDTQLGKGTTFVLLLPRSEEIAIPETVQPAESSGETPRGQETILVVEDNDLVRDVVLEMIGDLGYRALHAVDGSSAMAVLNSGEPVKLLFTDVVMPKGMSGIDLARIARAQRPGLRILLTSGYASEAAGGSAIGEFMLIAKPYRQADLARSIREALEA